MNEERDKSRPPTGEESAFEFDAPATSSRAVRGFTREQLVTCGECLRPNAPTRINCLYCGTELPVNEANAALRRPVLRQLEEWEQGFNVVLLPDDASSVSKRKTTGADVSAFDEAALLLNLDAERFAEMMSAGRALPLARAATSDDAAIIENRLGTLGLNVAVVPDKDLSPESLPPPQRIKRVELSDDALKGWSGVGAEAHAISWADVVMLVKGYLFTKRIAVEERGRLGRAPSVVDEREIFEDEGVLDLFAEASDGVLHWRIASDNFDYSCLGERKSLLARENFSTLVQTLRARAARATYDDEYKSVRHLLSAAWPLAEQNKSGGLRRESFGKFNVEAITVVSNEAQFTRYARLCHQLELKRRTSART